MAMQSGQYFVTSMRQALGRTPDARNNLWDRLNDAGRTLYTCALVKPWYHSWSWATRTAVPTTWRANDAALELDPTFGQVLDIDFAAPNLGRVRMTTPEVLNDFRQNPLTRGNDYWVSYMTGKGQPNRTRGAANVLSIWPVPTADLSLVLNLKQEWRELEESVPDDCPFIPAQWVRLLDLIGRDLAWTYQTSRPSFESSQIPAEIERLVVYDTGKQPKVGQATHSVMAAASRRGRFQYPHSRIAR